MKNFKKITTAIFAVILTVNFATAQEVKPAAPAEPFIVKYLGNEEDYLYFQVEINTGNNYSLFKIDDKVEGELYAQSWKNSLRFQNFKIEKKEGQELNFKLMTGNKVYSKSFSANTSMIKQTTVKENDVVIL